MSPKTVYGAVGGAVAVGALCIVLAAVTMRGVRATVTGHVTHRGKPVVCGAVVLVGSDGKTVAGRIAPDGTYTVENAPAAAVSVAVVSQDPLYSHYALQIKSSREKIPVKQWAAPSVDRKLWFPLPKRYEDPKSSGLTLILSRGANQCDLELP
jgi:hypothetical protein